MEVPNVNAQTLWVPTLVAALEEMAAEYRERTAEERARRGLRGVQP
jgi:hypothetical protein